MLHWYYLFENKSELLRNFRTVLLYTQPLDLIGMGPTEIYL